jgi:hypothetical protein
MLMRKLSKLKLSSFFGPYLRFLSLPALTAPHVAPVAVAVARFGARMLLPLNVVR